MENKELNINTVVSNLVGSTDSYYFDSGQVNVQDMSRILSNYNQTGFFYGTRGSTFTASYNTSYTTANLFKTVKNFEEISNLKLNKNTQEEFNKKFNKIISSENNILKYLDILENENAFKNLFALIKKTESVLNFEKKFNSAKKITSTESYYFSFNDGNRVDSLKSELDNYKEIFYNAYI